ncbi:MAG: DMT family transporter [Desulfobacteraceae bacterium]|jgi:drug/metabolite transporter (DMT)-like permease
MSWLVLSLLSALFLATTDALTKRHFSHLTAYEMGLCRLIYCLPFLLLAFFAVPWRNPNDTFYLCMAVALPLEATAYYGYMTAIKISPLSLTLPFLAFTPVFVLLTGWLLLKEFPKFGAIVGIAFIVVGAYCLNFSSFKVSYLAPIKAIVKERGSILMLVVSLIFAITSVLGKLAVLNSNAFFFGAVYFISFTGLQIAALPVIPTAKLSRTIQKPVIGLLTGATFAMMTFCHFLAITRIDAANMVAIKRTSMLFGTIYGWLWFNEEKMVERLLGVGLMLIGIFVIGWFG